MRKTADILSTIVDDLLCGDSTVYFEHGYNSPKLGTRTIIAVSTKQVIFKSGTKSLKTLKRDELLMVEKELKNYFEFVKQTV